MSRKRKERSAKEVAAQCSIDISKCDPIRDLVCRCPYCGYTDHVQCFDVLGADEGNIFCTICHEEFPVEFIDPKPLPLFAGM